MHYGEIKKCDIANGPGVRVSLFVSGCRNHCPGCFNKETWDFCYGKPFTTETKDHIMELLKPDYIEGFSLLGGEPFEPENQEELVRLLKEINLRDLQNWHVPSRKKVARTSGAIQDIRMTRICSKVVKYTHRLRKRCYLILIRWLMDSLSNPRKISH